MTQTAQTLIGPGEPERVQWTLDLVRSRLPLKGLRVLDLGCRIGSFAAAFHEEGAEVVGIEGRQSNLDYAQPGPVYVLGDVRDLPPGLGTFDVTLCLGILYHLSAGSAIRLLEKMRELTTGFAVVDTHIGQARGHVAVEGIGFAGQPHPEAPSHPWAAVDDIESWWFTPDSLNIAIAVAGWQNVEHITGKAWPGERDDRRWLVIS